MQHGRNGAHIDVAFVNKRLVQGTPLMVRVYRLWIRSLLVWQEGHMAVGLVDAAMRDKRLGSTWTDSSWR